MTYDKFLDELMEVLTQHRKSVVPKISRREVVGNLLVQIPGEDWSEEKLTNITTRKVRLQPDHVVGLIWSHEMAPYAAVREIERRRSERSPEGVICFDDGTSFQTSDIPYISSQGVTVRYLKDFLLTHCIDVFLITLDPGADTGKRHRTRNYFEIVWCIRGCVEMEFEVPGRGKPRIEMVQEGGPSILYNAAIPHVAREKKGKQALVYLISVKIANAAAKHAPASS